MQSTPPTTLPSVRACSSHYYIGLHVLPDTSFVVMRRHFCPSSCHILPPPNSSPSLSPSPSFTITLLHPPPPSPSPSFTLTLIHPHPPSPSLPPSPSPSLTLPLPHPPSFTSLIPFTFTCHPSSSINLPPPSTSLLSQPPSLLILVVVIVMMIFAQSE